MVKVRDQQHILVWLFEFQCSKYEMPPKFKKEFENKEEGKFLTYEKLTLVSSEFDGKRDLSIRKILIVVCMVIFQFG